MSYRNHEDEIMMSPRIHVQPRLQARGRSDQSPRSRGNQSPRTRSSQSPCRTSSQSPRGGSSQSPWRTSSTSPCRTENQSPRRIVSRSPTRRVPSPLRNAEFRPLAMEYAKTSPVTTSCKYFNDEEEPATPGGYCCTVRTVGYATVGTKPFMSGKCPNCKRMVKSERQVCTPNATPPPSPWKLNLQSPLRSPKNDQNQLQSPLRSPFKSSFFNDGTDDKPASPKPSGSSNPTRNLRSPGPRSPTGSTRSPRSPLRSPWRGSFFGGPKDDEEQSRSSKPAAKSRGAHSPGPCKSPGPNNSAVQSPGPRSPLRSPFKGSFFGAGSAKDEEEVVLVDPVQLSPKQAFGWRGPRSPLRSPFKGSFFNGGASPKGNGAPHIGSE